MKAGSGDSKTLYQIKINEVSLLTSFELCGIGATLENEIIYLIKAR